MTSAMNLMKTLKLSVFLSSLFMIMSCSKPEPNLTVTGEIRGLKKGTLYLERLEDSVLVAIDSMIVNGDPEFVLQANLSEPQVLLLRLDVDNTEPQRLQFFADSGITNINTSLKRYLFDAKILGSAQQSLWDDYNEMISQFNAQNLELIKSQLEAGEDSLKRIDIQKDIDMLIKRKYLYAINFAMTHKDSELSPYIALTEIYDANPKYLDTIYQALPEPILNSRYGIELGQFIQASKETTKE